jgi:putative FmdB family regulatory protein
MPTYEYVCENCGEQLEKFQSITAKPLRKCPKCGKNKLKRLIGAGAGVIFRGSGFYATDYRSEGYKKASESEKPTPAAKDAAKKEPETKAKPAKKDKSGQSEKK